MVEQNRLQNLITTTLGTLFSSPTIASHLQNCLWIEGFVLREPVKRLLRFFFAAPDASFWYILFTSFGIGDRFQLRRAHHSGRRDLSRASQGRSLIGGILALYLTGIHLSVSAAIGFIALFGQAVMNGVVMVSHFNELRDGGMEPQKAVIEGASVRLRTVLSCAAVDAGPASDGLVKGYRLALAQRFRSRWRR